MRKETDYVNGGVQDDPYPEEFRIDDAASVTSADQQAMNDMRQIMLQTTKNLELMSRPRASGSDSNENERLMANFNNVQLPKLELGPLGERALNFEEGIQDSRDRVTVLSDFGQDVFDAIMTSARNAYKRYMIAGAVEKTSITPDEVTTHIRTKNALSIIIKAALPKEILEDIKFQRKSNIENAMYLVHIQAQPGGTEERLAVHAKIGAPDIPRDANGAVRGFANPNLAKVAIKRWEFAMERAKQMIPPISIPDGTILWGILQNFAENQAKENYMFQHRFADIRNQTSIDTHPTEEMVLKIAHFLRAEFDVMTSKQGANSPAANDGVAKKALKAQQVLAKKEQATEDKQILELAKTLTSGDQEHKNWGDDTMTKARALLASSTDNPADILTQMKALMGPQPKG